MAAPGTPAGKSPIPPRRPGRVLGDDAVPPGEEPADARSGRRLPASGFILSNYFSVRDGKIVSLVFIFNQPASY
jgi:hypothetical protein